MKRRPSIIITSLLGLLLACAAQVFAHGGFDHVTGTVQKLENSILTVKTAKGDVAVTLDAKTEITRDDKPAQAADLKPGVRVVVDVPEGRALDQSRRSQSSRGNTQITGSNKQCG